MRPLSSAVATPLGRKVPLLVGSKTMSSGTVFVELLGSEVVYLHVNKRARVLVFPRKNVIPARRSAAAPRITLIMLE